MTAYCHLRRIEELDAGRMPRDHVAVAQAQQLAERARARCVVDLGRGVPERLRAGLDVAEF